MLNCSEFVRDEGLALLCKHQLLSYELRRCYTALPESHLNGTTLSSSPGHSQASLHGGDTCVLCIYLSALLQYQRLTYR